jgi:hypothetical protein
MMFWIELKAIVIVIKNSAPFLFCTPYMVPSQFWKRMMVKMAVMIVTINLTYDVCGSLIVFKKFLLRRSPS